eukprot:TRINITY_DN3236_c0_g2_i1.p1 TRINITY_DN3236_c0_g2~~TRINITY_DN3236_c0_g2_i1.p1  ORF type:complete len:297 (-),score=44.93 TRINITY_DN3236_c0_g2_i1:12-902(-)
MYSLDEIEEPLYVFKERAFMFIKGTYSPESDLFIFNGLSDSIVPLIFHFEKERIQNLFLEGHVACFPVRHLNERRGRVVERVIFPEPEGLYCNMMPFVVGSIDSLPTEYQRYYHLIRRLPFHPDEIGKVAYLTIDERVVEAGESHRRPGLHIESPGLISNGGEHQFGDPVIWGEWGGGEFIQDRPKGGIYMGSTVPLSCRVWNVKLDKHKAGEDVGSLGDIEHMRPYLGPCFFLKPNVIYWITDSTPHESMPLFSTQTRQFFRVVTPSISVWYDEHSTRNPLVEPEAEIIYGSKFK